MKHESSWSFSAPLVKVDIPRIIDEAADNDDTIGVVKVHISSPKGESTFVVADLDLAAAATMHRGVRTSDAFICNDTCLARGADGEGYVENLISPYSDEARDCIRSGRSGLVLFAIRDGEDVNALIGKLVDKVTVNVEAY